MTRLAAIVAQTLLRGTVLGNMTDCAMFQRMARDECLRDSRLPHLKHPFLEYWNAILEIRTSSELERGR